MSPPAPSVSSSGCGATTTRRSAGPSASGSGARATAGPRRGWLRKKCQIRSLAPDGHQCPCQSSQATTSARQPTKRVHAAGEASRPGDRRHRREPVAQHATERVREEAAVRHAGGEHAAPVHAALPLEPVEERAHEVDVARVGGLHAPARAGGAEEMDAGVPLGRDRDKAVAGGQPPEARPPPLPAGAAAEAVEVEHDGQRAVGGCSRRSARGGRPHPRGRRPPARGGTRRAARARRAPPQHVSPGSSSVLCYPAIEGEKGHATMERTKRQGLAVLLAGGLSGLAAVAGAGTITITTTTSTTTTTVGCTVATTLDSIACRLAELEQLASTAPDVGKLQTRLLKMIRRAEKDASAAAGAPSAKKERVFLQRLVTVLTSFKFTVTSLHGRRTIGKSTQGTLATLAAGVRTDAQTLRKSL